MTTSPELKLRIRGKLVVVDVLIVDFDIVDGLEVVFVIGFGTINGNGLEVGL